MIARWGAYELNPQARRLTETGSTVHLEPRAFDVLAYLIEHRERVVPKTELLDTLWGSRFVSEAALTTRIRTVRKAIGDSGKAQESIRTVHGVGYQFIQVVAEVLPPEPPAPVAAVGDAVPAEVGGSTVARILTPAKPLVGRDDELAMLDSLAAGNRLVTVIGPGGIGKTHLVTHFAARQETADSLGSDGVAFVALAELAPGGDLGPALLDAVGAAQQQGASALESAVRYLERRSALVVLDNAEHVIDEVRDAAAAITERCPAVTLVVTSRIRVELGVEAVLPVGPLGNSDAKLLFAEHAARNGFRIEPDQTDGLCARLDGIPLALELVASRTRILSVADLEADLQAHLGGGETGDDRHASLEAALSWSLHDLEPEARSVLGQLTVLVGSFDLDAAKAITDRRDVADVILGLCERSLVVARPSPTGSRFRILEPVRLFARAGEDDTAIATRRHVEYYRARSEEVLALLDRCDLQAALALARREWANLRAGVGYAVELADPEAALAIIAPVALYAEMTFTVELIDWCRAVRSAGYDDMTPAAQGALDGIEATVLAHMGRLDEATTVLDAAADGSEVADVPEMIRARTWMAWYENDTVRPDQHLDRLLALHAGTGTMHEVAALMLDAFGKSAAGIQDRPSVERVLELVGNDGPAAGVFADSSLILLALWDGDLHQAEVHAERAFLASLDEGLMLMAVGANAFRVIILAIVGDIDFMAPRLATALEFAVDRGLRVVLGGCLLHSASALADLDEWELAASALGAWEASPYTTKMYEMFSAATRERLTDHFGAGLDRRIAAGRIADPNDVALKAAAALGQLTG